ncbi:MAG: response regulator [Verrucomicrobiota bacterium]|nr:response regulator [Verrucomicrobiota bacterium]
MPEIIRILLIDDDPAVTQFFAKRLGSNPRYELLPTNSPHNVLTLAREFQPHVIVCDIDMDGMDGGEVCKALAGDKSTATIPFIFLSGLISAEELKHHKGMLSGRPLVSKSAKLYEIVQRIEDVVKGIPVSSAGSVR